LLNPVTTMPDNLLRLKPHQIEKSFVLVASDLKRNLFVDGIDQFEDPPGFRIRSHDPFGPMPEIVIRDTGDRYPVLENIQREAAKICAMVRIRDNIAAIFPGCKFLLSTKTDEGSLVGIRFAGRTIFAEHRNCWEAYHKLLRQAVREIL
jgi:hypothetical protein